MMDNQERGRYFVSYLNPRQYADSHIGYVILVAVEDDWRDIFFVVHENQLVLSLDSVGHLTRARSVFEIVRTLKIT